MHFRVLGYRMGTFLGDAKNSNNFLSMTDIHDTFIGRGMVKQAKLGVSLCSKKNASTRFHFRHSRRKMRHFHFLYFIKFHTENVLVKHPLRMYLYNPKAQL